MNNERVQDIKIHNNHGDVIGQLLPTTKTYLLGLIYISKQGNPLLMERWAWLTSFYIAKLYERAVNAGLLQDTPESVRELFGKLEGTFCFSCQKFSVRPKFVVGKLLGYSCTTENCQTYGVIIPKTLVRKIDEMPNYPLSNEEMLQISLHIKAEFTLRKHQT